MTRRAVTSRSAASARRAGLGPEHPRPNPPACRGSPGPGARAGGRGSRGPRARAGGWGPGHVPRPRRRALAERSGDGPARRGRTNCQDWVFIRPPGIPEGAFQLRIDNIWFGKLLLLLTIETKTDARMKKHACAFVSVLDEYKGHRRPGLHILHILHIIHICHIIHIYIYISCSVYSVYSVYSAYYDLIVNRMGRCLPVNHRLRAP